MVKQITKNFTKDSHVASFNGSKIILTQNMKEDVGQAERDLEEGRCLTEESFRERFAKWL